MTLLPVLLAIALTFLIVMSVWLYAVMTQNKQFLMSQIEKKDQTIADLTNKLLSKDPMTYQILSQVPTNSLNSEEYTPTGSDEAEYAQWAKLNGIGVNEDDDSGLEREFDFLING